jgi:circadian clock protein KaiB
MASSKTRDSAKPKKPRQAPEPESTVVDTKRKRAATLTAFAGAEDAGSADDLWTLRLYIAGDSPKSRTALTNLQRLCDTHLKGKYQIEVIDLKTRPELAKADQILALPTLIRKVPEPMKRLIGDLSNAERALIALELAASGAREGSKRASPAD